MTNMNLEEYIFKSGVFQNKSVSSLFPLHMCCISYDPFTRYTHGSVDQHLQTKRPIICAYDLKSFVRYVTM
jgi:hypothetical protein